MKKEEQKRRAKRVRKYLTRLGIIIGVVSVIVILGLIV
jgi:hypothetical protein